MKNYEHEELICLKKFYSDRLEVLLNKKVKVINIYKNLYIFIVDYHKGDEVKIKFSVKNSVLYKPLNKEFIEIKNGIKMYQYKIKEVKKNIKNLQRNYAI
jgi:hypothetical protein